MSLSISNSSISKIVGRNVLTCGQADLPCLVSGIWLSLSEARYADSHVQSHLRAIRSLYDHCFYKSGDPLLLDRIVLAGEIDQLTAHVRTFVAERQNFSAITGKDQSRTLRMVSSILKDVLNEIGHRNSSPKFDAAKMTRALSNLEQLYRFLVPQRTKKRAPAKSLPYDVVEEVFTSLNPQSSLNPFRTEKNRQRNFLIFVLLYQMGLRRGELLLLASNCMKAGYDHTAGRNLYWLDVKDSELHDPRLNRPKLKNEFSQRQIPLPNELYELLVNFLNNYRGRCSHGFLLSSQDHAPLSLSGLNKICQKLSLQLSAEAQRKLDERCMATVITPHNFRHSAATDRIRSYRHSGIEMNHAEAMMRAFFGWSPTSKMPLLYARAFYEEQVNSTWLEEFNHRTNRLLGYDKKV